MKIVIDSPEALEKAAGYYHDQMFDIDDIVFNEKDKTFSLEFIRVLYEEAVLKKDFILFQIKAAPKVKSILKFNHVNDMELHDKEPDDMINIIKYNSKKQRIEFDCCKGTIIRLKVDKLNGKLEDIGKKEVDVHKYMTLFYWIEVGHG